MVRYIVRLEPGVQTPEETLTTAAGSCRDSAWLLVQILRHIGLPARFVSGYLIQLKPDVKSLDGPSGAAQDFTDLHAWAEVYLPGAGWIGLDPTSGLLCGEGHLPVAATPHYRSAAPITGLVEPATVSFFFDMSITRIAEKPRVTAPFSDEAWAALDALGEAVDADLAAHDVRLTMGGEPTFVSIDDYQSAEWNTAALGPDQAQALRRPDAPAVRPLRPGRAAALRPGQVVSGRTAAALGVLAVLAPRRRADLARPVADRARGAGEGAAAKRRAALHRGHRGAARHHGRVRATRVRGSGRPHAVGRRVAANIDSGDPKIDDPQERARILRSFEQHLSTPAGYVLPVQRWTAQGKAAGSANRGTRAAAGCS